MSDLKPDYINEEQAKTIKAIKDMVIDPMEKRMKQRIENSETNIKTEIDTLKNNCIQTINGRLDKLESGQKMLEAGQTKIEAGQKEIKALITKK